MHETATLVIELPGSLSQQLTQRLARQSLSLEALVLQWLTKLAWSEPDTQAPLPALSGAWSLMGDVSVMAETSVLAVAGILPGALPSAAEIEQELYGETQIL